MRAYCVGIKSMHRLALWSNPCTHVCFVSCLCYLQSCPWLENQRLCFVGGGLPGPTSENSYQQPPETPRLFQYLAVPTEDRGLADSAITCQSNLRWSAPKNDRATYKDWQAYQNLLQLTGILSTAGIKNARQVWEHVASFVEEREMAQVELPPAKVPKTSFTTAQQLLIQSSLPRQSLSPASASAKAEPCAGVSPGGNGKKPPLSPEQIDLINKKREQALAIKQSKQLNEGALTPSSPAALPLAASASEQLPRSCT